MGYVLAHGPCFACGGLFSFNPVHVPSIPVDGVRRPICLACVDEANPKRIANGLEPIEPHPDAYWACDVDELPE